MLYSPDSPLSVLRISPLLLIRYLLASFFALKLLPISSGVRTHAHNSTLPNSVPDSSHVTGKGLDITFRSGRERTRVLRSVQLAGFDRIGVYSSHVHVDVDRSKPYPAVWGGGSVSRALAEHYVQSSMTNPMMSKISHFFQLNMIALIASVVAGALPAFVNLSTVPLINKAGRLIQHIVLGGLGFLLGWAIPKIANR